MELGAGFDKEGEPLSEEARNELEPCIQDVVAELEAEPYKKGNSPLLIPLATNKVLPSVVQAPNLEA